MKRFLVVGLALSFLLAGVVSYYASAHPDGLERVAEQVGFSDTAEESSASDGPLADYSVKGVDDERLGGGLAGIAGAATVLVLAGGLTWALRRRTPSGDPDGNRAD